MEELTQTPIRESALWRKTAPESSVERLHSFVKMRVISILNRQVQMRMVEVTEAVLPPDLLKRHTKAKRYILSEYRSILADGMKRGEFRAQDDRVAALGIIGIVNWTTKWYVAGHSLSVETISEQLADMAVASVALPSARRDSFKSAESALDTLRDDLNQLELLIKKP